MNDKIVLLGYMGSGKSTIGQVLADQLGKNFVDLDHYIEQQEESTITNIIGDRGVLYFRKLEKRLLEEILGNDGYQIIATGGGTPCYYDNMQTINDTPGAISYYLRATVPFLSKRLFKEKSHRPLISSISDPSLLAEFVGKHVLERSGYYDQAHHKIDVENKTPQIIAAEIIELISR